ncbi:MAG TPA: hypothetical protein VIU12_25800 [Chryseolinea sp.]
MKYVSFTLLLICLLLCAHGQTPNGQEFFSQKKTQIKYLLQQIAALKVHVEHLKEGYDIVQEGLHTASEIRDGKFSMDKTYLSSLKAVSPVVRNSPKLKASLGLQQRILDEFQSFATECGQEEMFSGDERDYVASVYANVLKHCDQAMAELEIIATAGQAEMQEEERLSGLDRVHEKLLDLYAFSQDFISSTRLLSLQRKKELEEIKSVRKLYQEI